jgi:hypothetical protein
MGKGGQTQQNKNRKKKKKKKGSNSNTLAVDTNKQKESACIYPPRKSVHVVNGDTMGKETD